MNFTHKSFVYKFFNERLNNFNGGKLKSP